MAIRSTATPPFAADVRNGTVSRESAAADYGVVLAQDGSIDEAATAAARKRG